MEPSATTPRAVLLDAMGTLVALEAPAPLLRASLAERLGVEVSERDAARAMRAEIALYRARHLEGSTPEGLRDLRRRCAALVRERLPALDGAPLDAVLEALLDSLRFRAQPDAAPALSALRAAGVALVAASNWDVSLHDVLESTGLGALLDGAVSSAEVGADKPAPAIFARALELAAAAPDQALHVGDRMDEDVAGARACGIRAVLLARGGAAPPGVETIRSLAELPGLVRAPP